MPIVRLKPKDLRKGHKLASLLDSANDGKRYTEGNLYEVTQAEADHLAWFMQDATRLDPKSQTFGKERAFDIWPNRELANRQLEEEGRGVLLKGSNQVFKAPGRNDAEAPALVGSVADTEIQAETKEGKRTFRGPPKVAAPVPATEPAPKSKPAADDVEAADDATFFDKDKEQPQTASQRRAASLARAQQRRTTS